MKRRLGIRACCLAILAALSIGAAGASSTLTAAFVGDQGTGENARTVLQLVADEGADLLLIQGDLGYKRGASAGWIAKVIPGSRRIARSAVYRLCRSPPVWMK